MRAHEREVRGQRRERGAGDGHEGAGEESVEDAEGDDRAQRGDGCPAEGDDGAAECQGRHDVEWAERVGEEAG